VSNLPGDADDNAKPRLSQCLNKLDRRTGPLIFWRLYEINLWSQDTTEIKTSSGRESEEIDRREYRPVSEGISREFHVQSSFTVCCLPVRAFSFTI